MIIDSCRPVRRARGDAEIGSDRIVTGMQAAIRRLRTSQLSRKDIAEFAKVTPPLVTYYFPDRGSLIEAATLPVVKAFSDDVSRCVSQSAPPERILWDLIELIVGTRTRDGALIDAYSKYRDENASQKLNPLLTVECIIREFFQVWLRGQRKGAFNAFLSQAALMGMCESSLQKTQSNDRYSCQLIYQIVICIVGDSEKYQPGAVPADAADQDFCITDRHDPLAP